MWSSTVCGNLEGCRLRNSDLLRFKKINSLLFYFLFFFISHFWKALKKFYQICYLLSLTQGFNQVGQMARQQDGKRVDQKTGWPDDQMTRRPVDQKTVWPDDRMTGWPDDVRFRWRIKVSVTWTFGKRFGQM
jgi:hypothetical protein